MNCSVDSAAVKKILQLEVSRVTSSSCLQPPDSTIDAGTRGRGDGEKGILMHGGDNFFIETASNLLPPQMKRCSHDTDIVYSCAIAFKLAPVLKLPAIDIAKQLVTALGEKFYCRPLGIYLNFQVEVVSSGWIYFWLKEESLAAWLQQLIFLGDGGMGRWGDGGMGR